MGRLPDHRRLPLLNNWTSVVHTYGTPLAPPIGEPSAQKDLTLRFPALKIEFNRLAPEPLERRTLTMREITQESIRSLFIEMCFQGTLLSTGTSFVISTTKGPHLVTNRHNVTGRNQETGAPLSSTCGVPDSIVVTHNKKGRPGHFVKITQPLYREDAPLWIEHPVLKSKADFVAIKLDESDGIDLFPYPIREHPSEILLGPSDVVSVIGFPFGLKASGLAVWSSGFVASEPDMDYDELPVLLIDCRSRQGQSGSPVVLYRPGGAIAMKNGSTGIYAGSYSELVGIYSGRIHKDSDLGMVWKTKAIRELLRFIEGPEQATIQTGAFSASGFVTQAGAINWTLSSSK